MPATLDRRDLRLLIAAGAMMLLLFGLTYAVSPAQPQSSVGYPSSDSSSGTGAKAAFLLLQDSGYRAERWDKSPEDLPSRTEGDVLVLAEPSQTGTSSERAAIRRFVSGGGRLLAMGASAADLAPDADAQAVPDWNPQPKIYSALVPSPLTRGADEITMVAPDSWKSSTQSWMALYGRDGNLAAVSYPVGRGEVIWWAAATPLTNGAIREKGNLAFFLNCLGAPADSHVFWDEYFHGARRTLASYFAETPLPWAGLQMGIAFLAIVVTFSRRSEPARTPASNSRLSPLEFVETLGDLYQSAHASPAAVAVAYRRFRFALSRELVVPAAAKLPQLCHAAATRFGWPEQPLLDTLARSERAMRSIHLDDRDALYLVRQLHEYSASLEPPGRIEQETPAWR
jgi:Domain of unknown function (DUF4350)